MSSAYLWQWRGKYCGKRVDPLALTCQLDTVCVCVWLHRRSQVQPGCSTYYIFSCPPLPHTHTHTYRVELHVYAGGGVSQEVTPLVIS